MRVHYPETALPILRDVDVAVVGGSLAGVAAALRLARGGLSVAVIEPRTYLGREITATLRPWLTLDDQATPSSLPAPLDGILAAQSHDIPEGATEIPLHPDTVKRGLEDALLGANANLLYASLPVELHHAEDGQIGLVIGNKSGRQVVRCQTVIDATETALVARLAGGTFEPAPADAARFRRTLEFDRVAPLDGAVFPVPEWLQIAEVRVRLHQGYRGPAHLLIEIELDLPYTADLEGAGFVEWEARRRSMGLANWLVSKHPAFAGARYAGSSHELHGRWTPSLAGPAPEWVGPRDRAVVRTTNASGTALELPSGHFAGPVPGLWCLNEASRLDDDLAGDFLDPVQASRLGEGLASALLET